jgi:hypothetical protein
MWFHFWSYKFARLLLPFALIAMALSGLGLPGPWFWLVTFGQASVYAMALVDLLVPEGWWLKRLTSPVRTFVALMVAALCALSFFFLPASALWRSAQVRSDEPASSRVPTPDCEDHAEGRDGQ